MPSHKSSISLKSLFLSNTELAANSALRLTQCIFKSHDLSCESFTRNPSHVPKLIEISCCWCHTIEINVWVYFTEYIIMCCLNICSVSPTIMSQVPQLHAIIYRYLLLHAIIYGYLLLHAIIYGYLPSTRKNINSFSVPPRFSLPVSHRIMGNMHAE